MGAGTLTVGLVVAWVVGFVVDPTVVGRDVLPVLVPFVGSPAFDGFPEEATFPVVLPEPEGTVVEETEEELLPSVKMPGISEVADPFCSCDPAVSESCGAVGEDDGPLLASSVLSVPVV